MIAVSDVRLFVNLTGPLQAEAAQIVLSAEKAVPSQAYDRTSPRPNSAKRDNNQFNQ